MANSLSALSAVVDIALGEVGVREEGGDNLGARIAAYQEATWLPPGPWPWCAAFASWVMREWLTIPEARNLLALPSAAAADKWRCRDARAFGWEPWAASRGLAVLPEGTLARRGDFIVFDFSHIGIVREDQADVHMEIHTIEGNTNGAGGGHARGGDGVWLKSRSPSLAKSLLRIADVGVPSLAPWVSRVIQRAG